MAKASYKRTKVSIPIKPSRAKQEQKIKPEIFLKLSSQDKHIKSPFFKKSYKSPKVFLKEAQLQPPPFDNLDQFQDSFGPLQICGIGEQPHSQRQLTVVNNLPEKRLIIIDPGHGGIDPGTISPRGYCEKNVTLAFAKEIKDILNQTQRYQVILTRSQDETLSLQSRHAIARDLRANLFISLHADSNPHKKLEGFAVYTLSANASDEEAQSVAQKENKADHTIGLNTVDNCPETRNILLELAQRDTFNRSVHFADCFLQHATADTRKAASNPRYADFAVLKAPDIPSVLIELGYLSNTKDEARLIDKNYQKKIAHLLVKAIDNFFESIH